MSSKEEDRRLAALGFLMVVGIACLSVGVGYAAGPAWAWFTAGAFFLLVSVTGAASR